MQSVAASSNNENDLWTNVTPLSTLRHVLDQIQVWPGSAGMSTEVATHSNDEIDVGESHPAGSLQDAALLSDENSDVDDSSDDNSSEHADDKADGLSDLKMLFVAPAAAPAAAAAQSKPAAGGSRQRRPSEAARAAAAAEPPSAEAVLASATAAAAAACPPPPVTQWKLSGQLSTVVAGSSSTFTIEGLDASSQRRRSEGGDKFNISLTGAAVVRARVYDEGDGLYTVEYKLLQTGKYRLSVMRAGQHLPGSPFSISAKAGEAKKSLKDWKVERSREAANLRAARKLKQQEKKTLQQEKLDRKREPSPRINAAEQLAKAYALALAAARSDKRVKHRSSSSGSAGSAAALQQQQQQQLDLGV